MMDSGWTQTPTQVSSICITSVKESHFRIVDKNRRNHDEVKENSKQSNSLKRTAHIIKRGRLYDNNLYTVANILSDTKTTEESNY